MITREMIKNGLDNGNISLTDDMSYGLMSIGCKIGDNAFYFAGSEIENYETVDSYLADHTEDEIVDYIYEVIKDEQAAEDNGLGECEYAYYVAVLS